MSFDPAQHPRTPAGSAESGRSATVTRTEPDVSLAEATTCIACGARGAVDEDGRFVDEHGGATCPANEPDGHVAADGAGSAHPAQVRDLVRRVRRLQASPGWADGSVDIRPLLAAAVARLDVVNKQPGLLAGLRTVMSSPAWEDGDVNVAPLLADAIDHLVPRGTDQRTDTVAFAHLLASSPLARSPELRQARVNRQATAQRPGLVLPAKVYDPTSRRPQHVVLVLDADRTVSTWCGGGQLDSFTWNNVWSQVVSGTDVSPADAPEVVADLLAAVDAR